jgi:hypothetical protein
MYRGGRKIEEQAALRLAERFAVRGERVHARRRASIEQQEFIHQRRSKAARVSAWPGGRPGGGEFPNAAPGIIEPDG